jgi:4-hydroxy-tetrahydrodipicolinate reductase
MIKVIIAGISGKVGKALATKISEQSDLQIVGAVSRTKQGIELQKFIELDSGPLTSESLELDCKGPLISGSLEEAMQTAADVLVDYTSAQSVKSNVLMALNNGLHVVVGSSGLSAEDYLEIDALAKRKNLGVIAAGNFSITAGLLQHFSKIAAQYIPNWEILDFGSATKIDAPSGTARETAQLLAKAPSTKTLTNIGKNIGDIKARGATVEDTQIHSIRLPSFYSSAEIIFGAGSERLTIRHDSLGADPYVMGTLLAIRKVTHTKGLSQGILKLLELE